MKQYILLLLFTLLTVSIKAQPPNNPIFTGGVGDGMSNASWLVAASNIFAGGQGDGETVGINTVTPNSIYAGGEGDGFSFNTNNALPNNIFSGGEGDGWSAIVLPLGPLPVELLSFSAEYAGEAHLLQWSTAAEINTMQFEVQRSADARNFHALGTVEPAGSASSGDNYRFRVNEPLNGNNFYRLKIVDNDGSFSFSNIVLLNNSGNVKFSLYPNPTADILNIILPTSGELAATKAIIYDAQGKLVLQPQIFNNLTNAIDISALPPGVYTIHCSLGGKIISTRFLKMK